MDLYYSPLACSMATRITLYEADIPARFIGVDTRIKKLFDGSDFLAVNPIGQVPVLRTDEGELLTENPAVLQYVADRKPGSGLVPQGGMGRYRVQQWMNFTTSELHKVVFVPLLDPTANEEVKAYSRQKAETRLSVLNEHLGGREYLSDRFTIADAYLATVLNWANYSNVDLGRWPGVKGYMDRMYRRPSVARAVEEEAAQYREMVARRG
jgi:glutathione S-transferase